MNPTKIAFEKAKNEIATKITTKYNFEIVENKFNKVLIIKNDVKLYITFDIKEGTDLIFLKSDWEHHQAKRFMSFVFLKYSNYKIAKPILDKLLKKREEFIDDYNYFIDILMKKVLFIEQHFPNVFQNGDLSMFDN